MRILIKILSVSLMIGLLCPPVFAEGDGPQEFTISGEYPAISPDGKTVFVGKGRPDFNNDNHYLVDMYDVKTGALLKEIPTYNASNRFEYSSNGKYLVSPGTYTSFFDGKTGDELFTFPYYFPQISFQKTNDDVVALTFPAMGNVLLKGNTLTIYDLATNTKLFEKTYNNLETMRVAMHPTQPIVAVSHGLNIDIINYDTGETLQTITNPFQMNEDIEFWAIKYLQYSPDGKTLSAINMFRGIAPFKQFDVENNYKEITPSINVFANETSKDNMPTRMSYSPDGSEVYFYYTGKMKAFDVKTGKFKWEINGDLNDIVFSSDMKKISYTKNYLIHYQNQPTFISVKDFPFPKNNGERLEFDEPLIQLKQGDSTYFLLEYIDEKGQRTLLEPKQVTLESMDPTIADIDSSHKIVAKSPGNTTLKASYDGLVTYLSVEIKAPGNSKIKVGPIYESTTDIYGIAPPQVTLYIYGINTEFQTVTNDDGSFKIHLREPLVGDTSVGFMYNYKTTNGADYDYEHILRNTVKPGPPMPAGWVKYKNQIYYLDNSGNMKTGWIKMNNHQYYFNLSGPMLTGWLKYSNHQYYFNSSGIMQTGWVKGSNHTYYFNSNGTMATGWLKYSNHMYYLNSSGTMQTGMSKINNHMYYFSSNGTMATGWLKYSNHQYNFNSSGIMQTGWLKDKGKWYYFYSNGIMAHDTKVGKYRIGHSGARV
jgi:hypothetical protein